MKENIETKDVQRTEYLDKNGLDMLWANVKENTHNQVEVERDRATTQENRIIETKADKSELHSSYVSNSTFAALQEKVAANTDAIRDKLDAGNYIPYESIADDDNINYKTYVMKNNEGILFDSSSGSVSIKDGIINIKSAVYELSFTPSFIWLQEISDNGNRQKLLFELDKNGLRLRGGDNNHVLTSYGSTIDITQYAKKTELPTVPAKTSELQNDSEFITKSVYDEKIAALEARIAALEAKHTETA